MIWDGNPANIRPEGLMARKWKSYLGGHTVLTQSERAFMHQLEVDASKARRRAERDQEEFDRRRNDPDYRRRFDKKALELRERQLKKRKKP
jgi:hypothetical protein